MPTMVRSFLLLVVFAFGVIACPSCGRVKAAGAELPAPELDDRPAGSPPELPRVSVELPPEATTAPGRILAKGDDLQDAIDDAKPGDVIALAPGAVFNGTIKLRRKSGDGWITIRTNATSFPNRGTRAAPSMAAMMPVIEAGSDSAITAEEGAHHYRFVGVEIRPEARAFLYNLIDLGGGATSFDDTPHHIVFERCYIHGDAESGGRRGVAMNSRETAVVDSYVSGFKEEGNDSQAIAGWNGAGPFLIANNYIEAAGENVLFGGADPEIRNLVPSDIEIRGNQFAKQLSWWEKSPTYAGTRWTVKNLLELKNARRVVIDRNLFEYNWPQGQNGFAILFTPRNQDGGSPWTMVRDVTFTRNIVRHTAAAVNISGSDDIHPSQQTKRILIRDNLFDDVDGKKWDGSGRLFQVMAGTADVVIEHNTAFHTGDVITSDAAPNSGFVYRNNLTRNNDYGVGGTNTYGNPMLTLTTYFPGGAFVKNVLVGGWESDYPADNFFPPSLTDVGFVDMADGNYRLADNSPYKHAATDGKDIGADFDAPDAQQGRRRAVGRHG